MVFIFTLLYTNWCYTEEIFLSSKIKEKTLIPSIWGSWIKEEKNSFAVNKGRTLITRYFINNISLTPLYFHFPVLFPFLFLFSFPPFFPPSSLPFSRIVLRHQFVTNELISQNRLQAFPFLLFLFLYVCILLIPFYLLPYYLLFFLLCFPPSRVHKSIENINRKIS